MLGMGGDDRGRVRRATASSSRSTELEPLLGQRRDVRVVVGDVGAELAQALDDLQRRRLAQVADAGLVGDAERSAPASP